MLIYFVILVLCCFFIYIADYYKNEIAGKGFYALTILVLVFFGGLRNRTVGTDSNNYAEIYKTFAGVGFFQEANSTLEIGFQYLMKFTHLISDSYTAMFLFISFLFVIVFIILIKKFSYNNSISLFVFITLGKYMIYFNAARQSLAVAFFTISIYYIYRKKIFPFLVLVMIGSLFHKSILILLPFYYLLNIKYNLRNFIWILIVSSVVFVVGGKLMLDLQSTSLEKYSGYIDRDAKGGGLLCVFYSIISIFFIIVREQMVMHGFKLIKVYDFYLKLCLFSTMIYVIVVITGSDVNMIRMTAYFSLGYILIWPIVFLYIKAMKYDFNEFLYGFVVVHLLFLYVMLSKMGSLIPYQLSTEIF